MALRSAGLVILLVAIVGCSSQFPPATPIVAIGGTWTVVDVAGLTPDPRHRVEVQFTVGGLIQGVSGCSEFEATAQVAGEHLAIGPIRRHAFAPCTQDALDVEVAFLRVLQSAERISGGPGRLVFEGPDGAITLAKPA